MLIDPIPLVVAKPALSVPPTTTAPELPPFKVVKPAIWAVPGPVLMRFPPVLVTLEMVIYMSYH